MLYLSDQNFEKEIQKSQKAVLVYFFGVWCSACQLFSPIFEKLEKEFENEIVFVKIDTDSSPEISLKYGIKNLPTVLYFEKGKPVAGFVGLKSEEEIKSWLKELLSGKEKREAESLLKEIEEYARNHALKLNSNEKIVETIIKGLLANEKKYGWRFCPCRRLSGDFKEDWRKICPCAFHFDEIEKEGRCHCGLFVKSEDSFN